MSLCIYTVHCTCTWNDSTANYYRYITKEKYRENQNAHNPVPVPILQCIFTLLGECYFWPLTPGRNYKHNRSLRPSASEWNCFPVQSYEASRLHTKMQSLKMKTNTHTHTVPCIILIAWCNILSFHTHWGALGNIAQSILLSNEDSRTVYYCWAASSSR